MKKIVSIVLIMLLLFSTGCSATTTVAGVEDNAQSTESGFMPAVAGNYDSADTAVVVGKSLEDGTITFQNLELGKKYTLTYDGTTVVQDKYEQNIAMTQIAMGDIVDITFVKGAKWLNSIMVSPLAWSNTNISKFQISATGKSISIATDQYAMDDNAVVCADDKLLELMDLNEKDVITVNGLDTTVYSIVVERGHGYLRLKNDEYFIGGWIEVGQALIQVIKEDMLLVVPEGDYEVLLTNTGISGVKDVSITRNTEIELDIGDLEPEEVKSGKIAFTISPASALVYIDGELVDTSAMVEMEYGIHQMIVMADGYTSVTQYLKVGSTAANVNVELEAEETEEEDSDEDDDTVATATTSGVTSSASTPTNVTGTSQTDYRVYIDSPTGVEVYIDGSYLGIAPIDFKKVAGTYVLTLRQTGYQTRSYTLSVDSEAKDISYSFSALEALQ